MNNHLNNWAIETHVSIEEREWMDWIDDVELLLEENPDGELSVDGFSLDTFYDLWKQGYTQEQAIKAIPHNA